MKKISKTKIAAVLRSQNATEIFKIAKLAGVDVTNKTNVFRFIEEYAPTKRVLSMAYRLSYDAGFFKNFRCYRGTFKNDPYSDPICEAIRFAKMEKREAMGNYKKILFIGDRNIYWCHPGYGHSDYNKWIAFANTDKNMEIAKKINKFLGYTLS